MLVPNVTTYCTSNFDDSHRRSHRKYSIRKDVPRNFAKFTGKHLCQSLLKFRPQACNFIKKETLAQAFSCKFCEISKNTFFTELLRATASDSHSGSVRKESLRNCISSRYDISFCFCVFKCRFRTHLNCDKQFMKI